MLPEGISYSDFVAQMAAEAAAEHDLAAYTALNLKRATRIHRTYRPSEAVQALVAQIRTPQTWLVLTEGWCGDSAQTLPYFVEVAKHNPLIDLRIVLRDAHPDWMDRYLTEGKRAIPIIVAFDADGTALFRWGPRPAEAADLFARGRADGVAKAEIYQHLHLWYGRNRGKAVEAEITELLMQATNVEAAHVRRAA